MTIAEFIKKENNNLDLARMFLAAMVIIGHGMPLNGDSEFWNDPIHYLFGLTYTGSLAVKLFFFVSGMLVTYSIIRNRSAKYFVISRTFRVVPALLFVLLCTVIIIGPLVTTLSVGEYFQNPSTWTYLGENLIFDTNFELPGVFADNHYKNAVNGSLWSLRYEVGCYIGLLAIFMILGAKNTSYLNIPVAVILLEAFIPGRFLFGWIGENTEFTLLPLAFAFGSAFALHAEKIRISLKTVAGCYLLYFIFSRTYFGEIIFIFFFSTAVIYLAGLPSIRRLRPKYDISYGIYLWGFVVQQTIYHYLGHLYTGLHCLLALVISVILALVTHVVIEKPFIMLGKKLNKKFTHRTDNTVVETPVNSYQ